MKTLNHILFVILLLCACKEKSQDILPLMCGFAPYTNGSTFNYEYVSGTDTVHYTLTVTGDTVINGRTFSILNSGTASQYIRCDDGRYYLFEAGIDLPDYHTEDGLRLFLHETRDEWTDTINTTVSGKNEITLLQYKILQKGSSRTILDHAYEDVVGVRQNAAVLREGTVNPLGTVATYYYARDIGYIQAIGSGYTISLLSFSIK
jgi:hypothetical protein